MKDPLGNFINTDKKYQRIISLVPSQTELLYDLGLENEVVGITKFCIHPSHWRKEKTIVGGTKNFRFDVIDSLQPDLIIANKEENYKEGIEQLQEQYPVYISDIYTLEDSFQMMEAIGVLTQKTKEATSLIKNIRSNFEKLNFLNTNKVAYLIWNEPIMVAGSNNFINEMLRKCGLINVFENIDRYPQITEEELQKAQPDYIFLSSEPYPFKEKHLIFFKNILPKSKVILVDGEYFSWYGSRLENAPLYFQKLLENIR